MRENSCRAWLSSFCRWRRTLNCFNLLTLVLMLRFTVCCIREKSQSETVVVAHFESVVSCGAKDEITGHQAFGRFRPASLPKPIARSTADMRSDLRSSIVAMNAQSIPPDLACLIRQLHANPRSDEHNCSSSSKQPTCLCSYGRL